MSGAPDDIRDASDSQRVEAARPTERRIVEALRGRDTHLEQEARDRAVELERSPETILREKLRSGEASERMTGYVTREKFIVGRTPQEMEKILGLPAEELKNGAYILAADRMPTIEEFEPAGYTNTAGQKLIELNRERYIEEALGNGMSVEHAEQSWQNQELRLRELALTGISSEGPDRLVKVVKMPEKEEDSAQQSDSPRPPKIYPPGLGAVQYNILDDGVPARVVAILEYQVKYWPKH